jgi:RNA polymerase-binding protein DksA
MGRGIATLNRRAASDGVGVARARTARVRGSAGRRRAYASPGSPNPAIRGRRTRPAASTRPRPVAALTPVNSRPREAPRLKTEHEPHRQEDAVTLSTRQRAEIRALLDARHASLLEEIREELEDSTSTQYIELIDRSPADEGDQSVGDALADLNLAIIDRHVNELRDVERARERIADGTFGVCIDCGDDIAFERLASYPTAKRCVVCQQQRERTYAHGRTPSL